MLTTEAIQDVACSDSIAKYIYKLCRLWNVPRQDSGDLVQEARVEILACASRFRPDMGTAIQWCRGIARNKIRQYLTECTRRQEFFSAHHPDVHDPALMPSTPEDRTLRKEAACFLSDAFEHELSKREVDVIIAHTVDEMPHAEISDEYGISVSNSQKCHKRALDELACCIPNSLRAIMPVDLIGCNDTSPRNGASSRKHDIVKWSHYAGHVAVAVLACLMLLPSNRAPQPDASIPGKIRAGYGRSMYQPDKQTFASDKHAVCPKPPTGKPEPAPLPSVRAVPVPTTAVDKLATIWQPAPLPPFKPTDRTSAHVPLGQ